MGVYLNPGSAMFRKSLRSKIYVDKSGLLSTLNDLVDTEQRYVCVSRPRRFGKSMAANMLAAYYGSSEDTDALFSSLEISKSANYRDHLNQYDVLKINMQDFLSESNSIKNMLETLSACLIRDLKNGFSQIQFDHSESLVQTMREVFAQTGRSFIILIDEWDCLFREYQNDKEAQKQYLDFLRVWLKDKEYVGLAYMTGILPIKKYGSHSALNMFTEYSMTNPREMAGYFGFTEDEVRRLCEQYQRSFDEMQAWYDGYDLTVVNGSCLKTYAMYNPKSVVEAMLSGVYDNYWNQTESYEALKIYIQMNYDGLKDAVVRMLAGDRIQINTGTFSNDMTTFEKKDDVLTLLVHLGYLSYHWPDKTVTIPNKEVSQEYVNAISTMALREYHGNLLIAGINYDKKSKKHHCKIEKLTM